MERIIGTGVIVKRNRRICVLQRNRPDKPWPNLWCLPGGKVEIGESVYDCAKRELNEEAGINCEKFSLVGSTYIVEGNQEYLTFILLAKEDETYPRYSRTGPEGNPIEWWQQSKFLKSTSKMIPPLSVLATMNPAIFTLDCPTTRLLHSIL